MRAAAPVENENKDAMPPKLSLTERLHAHGLGAMAAEILGRHGCTLLELESESQRRHVVGARRELAEHMRSRFAWSNGAIADLLGRDASTVSNLLHPKRRARREEASR